MEIKVADERVLVIAETLTFAEAEEKAWSRKLDSFGTLNRVTSFLTKPKDEEFSLTYKEFRYQPFWHVSATARYVYDRNSTYQIPVGGPEVKSVTLEQKEYETMNGHIHSLVTEHCRQESLEDALIDGVTGERNAELEKYLKLSAKHVPAAEIQSSLPKNAIVVPPQFRVSALMREMLSKMIKGIQADKIFEEHVEVTCVDLYYRPVYAFQYAWKTKGKDAILEIDGTTGDVKSGNRTFKEYFGKVLDRDFLFDIGADTAGMLIPGGSIAVKVAKKYIDNKPKP